MWVLSCGQWEGGGVSFEARAGNRSVACSEAFLGELLTPQKFMVTFNVRETLNIVIYFVQLYDSWFMLRKSLLMPFVGFSLCDRIFMFLSNAAAHVPAWW
jgi:hypothetical protein